MMPGYDDLIADAAQNVRILAYRIRTEKYLFLWWD